MDVLPLLAALTLTAIIIVFLLRLRNEQRKNREKERVRLVEQEALRQEAEREEQRRKRELLVENREIIQKAYDEYQGLHESNSYFTIKSYRDWETRWNTIKPLTQINIQIDDDIDDKLRCLRNVFSSGEKGVRERNNAYVSKELLSYKAFFDGFQGKSLTEGQRRAAVVDEHSNIVVAGAGTGKTHTLLAKASYIAEKGLSKPEKLLLMSFNSDVRTEIEEKCGSLNLPCQVETYHSLGLRLIAEAQRRQPSVTKLTEDRNKFVAHIQRYLDQLTGERRGATLTDILTGSHSDPQRYRRKLLNYFSYYSREYINPFDFDKLGDYYRYIRDNGLTSLKNDRVKSYEEFEIANYLYLNGVDYEYEEKYRYETADVKHRQYEPDFYLPRYGVYIEHFAVNRRGRAPPFINESDYQRGIEWKRDVHRRNGTILVETYSYEHDEGTLIRGLEAKLLEHGVELKPIPAEEALRTFRESGEVTLFANLIAKFLNLFKASGKSIQEIREAAKSYGDPQRAQAFLDLFEPILELYQSELKASREVDFNDMIVEATRYIDSGLTRTDFSYILVDEFQDISQSRFRFLKALQKSSNAKLFCVGDDWQAIYRFTGGDISLMTNFNEYFSPSERLNLDKTFRFNSGILDVSSQFIMQNPGQLRKRLVTDDVLSIPTVTVKWVNEEDRIDECLYLIEEFSIKEQSTVFILGRYRRSTSLNLDAIRGRHPSLIVEYHTVHGSKGLEADYVILIDVNGGVKGFPCLIEDDSLLSLVLSRAEKFPNAEERRLFYVALTRARKGVYILSDFWDTSDFVEELVAGQYPINIDTDHREVDSCPVCVTGKMMPINGRYGLFYRCSNHPLCKNKMNPKTHTRAHDP